MTTLPLPELSTKCPQNNTKTSLQAQQTTIQILTALEDISSLKEKEKVKLPGNLKQSHILLVLPGSIILQTLRYPTKYYNYVKNKVFQ